MTDTLLIKLIYTRFGSYKQVKSEIQVNCPFCILRRPDSGPDTNYKLYINIEKKVYNCFRCEVRGRLAYLFPQLETIGVKADEVSTVIQNKDNTLEPLPAFQYFGELQYPWNEIVDELLAEKLWTKEQLWDKVYFVEDYKKGDFSFGPSLLFPVYQFGAYRGFQARTVYKNKKPKYIGASNMVRSSLIYNYDTAFSNNDLLVITEGFLDCLRIGNTAIATLGKSITDVQLRLIRLGQFNKVIVFLDRDAEKEARTVAKQLALYFTTYIALPPWHKLPTMPTGDEKKDPGDMVKEEIKECFKDHLERIY